MKTAIIAATFALTAFAALPASARSDTHISFGFYTPAPVYYTPAPVMYQPPVVYYPPVQHVYYAPRPCPEYYEHEAWEHRHFHHGYATAWNDHDRDDRDEGRHEGWHR